MVDELRLVEELSDKAIALIHRLAEELDHLAYAVDVDYKKASPAQQSARSVIRHSMLNFLR